MKIKSCNKRTVRVMLIWTLFIVFAIPGVGTTKVLKDGQLLNRGLKAYERLPKFVNATSADSFVKAVMYLYAYEQKGPRAMKDNPQHALQISSSLDWLRSNLKYLTAYAGEKGDAGRIRSNGRLLELGCNAYNRLPEAKQISSRHGEAFIGAIANFYAYYQRTGNANTRPCKAKPKLNLASALKWLNGNVNRLKIVRSSAKGDEVDAVAWLPRGPQPKIEKPGQKKIPLNPKRDLAVSFGEDFSKTNVRYISVEVKNKTKNYCSCVNVRFSLLTSDKGRYREVRSYAKQLKNLRPYEKRDFKFSAGDYSVSLKSIALCSDPKK